MRQRVSEGETAITIARLAGKHASPTRYTPETTGGTPRCFSPKNASAKLSSSSAVPTASSIEFSSRVATERTRLKSRSKTAPTAISVTAAPASATK